MKLIITCTVFLLICNSYALSDTSIKKIDVTKIQAQFKQKDDTIAELQETVKDLRFQIGLLNAQIQKLQQAQTDASNGTITITMTGQSPQTNSSSSATQSTDSTSSVALSSNRSVPSNPSIDDKIQIDMNNITTGETDAQTYSQTEGTGSHYQAALNKAIKAEEDLISIYSNLAAQSTNEVDKSKYEADVSTYKALRVQDEVAEVKYVPSPGLR